MIDEKQIKEWVGHVLCNDRCSFGVHPVEDAHAERHELAQMVVVITGQRDAQTRQVERWQHAAHQGCVRDNDGKLLCEPATPGNFARAIHQRNAFTAALVSRIKSCQHCDLGVAKVVGRSTEWRAMVATQAHCQNGCTRDAELLDAHTPGWREK